MAEDLNDKVKAGHDADTVHQYLATAQDQIVDFSVEHFKAKFWLSTGENRQLDLLFDKLRQEWRAVRNDVENPEDHLDDLRNEILKFDPVCGLHKYNGGEWSHIALQNSQEPSRGSARSHAVLERRPSDLQGGDASVGQIAGGRCGHLPSLISLEMGPIPRPAISFQTCLRLERYPNQVSPKFSKILINTRNMKIAQDRALWRNCWRAGADVRQMAGAG